MISRRYKTSIFGLLAGLSIGVGFLFLIFLHNNKGYYSRIPKDLEIDILGYWQANDKPNSKSSPLPDFGSILNLDQNDAKLLDYIRRNHLTPPSEQPYNLTSKGDHANGYSSFVKDYFKDKKTGTFIEAGAYDGEEASNTLYFELQGWRGLLVECNPHLLNKLMSKNRKAWIADVCLSTKEKSDKVELFSSPEWPASAQIDKQLSEAEMKVHGIDWMKNKTWQKFERPTFPLFSILAATQEFEEIDLLSLDVQGAEIGILKHFPFHIIPIKLIIAEVFMFSQKQRNEFKEMMFSKGYGLLKDMGFDYVFELK